mgnify:CR=1 FL=1
MKIPSERMMIVANFLGAILFLIGGVRFFVLFDVIGGIVFILAGVISITLASLNMRRLKK